MVNDRTLVPIHAVAEHLGYTVGWDEASQTVTNVQFEQHDKIHD